VEIDARALRLLRYLCQRVTIAVGNNAPQIAEALGMSEEELRLAADLLIALRMASGEPMSGGVRRWGVTDAGLAHLEARRTNAGPHRRP
jgi:hypothetical protein